MTNINQEASAGKPAAQIGKHQNDAVVQDGIVAGVGAEGVPGPPRASESDSDATAALGSVTSPLSPLPVKNIFDEILDAPQVPVVQTPAPPPAPEPPSEAVRALRHFYTRLHLTSGDRDLLWAKRGLTPATVEALGFRSNLKANKQILDAMPEEFPMLVLMDSGLWQQSGKAGDAPKPNPQYHGMALVQRRDAASKKVRDRDGNEQIDCVWGDPGPILIPYYNAAGELVALRPHKGMMKERMPRFYVARPAAEYRAAHPEVLVRAVGVAALPGITMAKPLFGDVEEWLEDLRAQYAVITEGEFKAAALWQLLNGAEFQEPPQVKQVMVGYDSEDKSNPALPGYQEDKWKRYPAEIWARFLARQVTKEGYDGKVCHLPDAWRDEKGKADWDGWLTRRLRELEVRGPEEWPLVHARLRAEAEAVVKRALPVKELWQAEMFDSEEERIIKNGLERISHERMLPVGGEDEANIARRLQRLVPRLKRSDMIPPKSANLLYLLAKQYQTVQGRYYVFKKLNEKTEAQWQLYLLKAAEASDTDLKRACEIALKGMPQFISDFYMKAQHVLVKMTGERIRLVTLHNVHGVVSVVKKLPAEAFAQPAKFREWLLNSISGATWIAGERELQAMQMDIARDLARKEIEEVVVRGYHKESRCWYYGDVVYTPDGREIFADRNGIIWVKSDGDNHKAYQLSEQDHEDQDFCQKTPLMHPRVPATDEEVKQLFEAAANQFYLTLGDYSAFMAMGVQFAAFAGPEIYAEFGGVPLLWVHGETKQGKSSVVRWLMKIGGFEIDKGMPLADSTKVGLSIALQQYGELPVWLEEWQGFAPPWMVEKIKNIHNRESGIKKTFDEHRREIIAGAVVTGIATCGDAQVKSRFAHVQVAAKNRKADTYRWFQETSPRFYQFGRHILRHRKQFAARVIAIMRGWNEEAMDGVDGRAKLVHGAAYAAFVAFNELLPVFEAPALTLFKEFLVGHAQESVRAVNDQVHVNQFWRLVSDAAGAGAFGETRADLRHVFKFIPHGATEKPADLTPHQLKIGAEHPAYDYLGGKLYFKPGQLLGQLSRHLRQMGQNLPLVQADLQAQMKTRDYWVVYEGNRRNHEQKFGGKTRELCWCIDMDKHEMGRRKVSDEEYDASLKQEGKGADEWVKPDDWSDPRRGDLFALVERLEKTAEDKK